MWPDDKTALRGRNRQSPERQGSYAESRKALRLLSFQQRLGPRAIISSRHLKLTKTEIQPTKHNPSHCVPCALAFSGWLMPKELH